MTAFTTPSSLSEAPETPLQRLLRLAHVRQGQTVCVAGPGSLDLTKELCRAGFGRVECARQATSTGADETSDLLILTGPAESLGGLAARTAPLLRNGGVLAAWLERTDDDQPIRFALLAHGLEITTSTLDICGGLAVIHRVWRPGRLALAS
jgi:hypothetical protein